VLVHQTFPSRAGFAPELLIIKNPAAMPSRVVTQIPIVLTLREYRFWWLKPDFQLEYCGQFVPMLCLTPALDAAPPVPFMVKPTLAKPWLCSKRIGKKTGQSGATSS